MAIHVDARAPTRLLIVNADDYGLTLGVSHGILRAHRSGVVTSTSVLTVAPAFESCAAALRDAGLAAGLHLALVGEDPPLLTRREVPTLVDGRGMLRRSWRELAIAVNARRVDPDDLRREATAQLNAMLERGLRPTHVDSHQHVHLLPVVADVVQDLCVERSIPALRVPRADGWHPRMAAVEVLGRRLARRSERCGLRHTQRFVGISASGRMDEHALCEHIDRLARSGASSAEIGVHPGEADDPERVRYAWGFDWAGELSGLQSSAVAASIRRHRWTLGSYRDLQGE